MKKKNGVKIIQTAGYNSAHMVFDNKLLELNPLFSPGFICYTAYSVDELFDHEQGNDKSFS